MNLNKIFPVDLDSLEQSELDSYTGKKHTLFDNNGNIVSNTDTRTLRGEKLKLKSILKQRTRDCILDKCPLNKQLNVSELDPEEQAQLKADKKHYLDQYETLKSNIANATTLDDLENILKGFKDAE